MATLLEEITALPTMNILLEKLKVISEDEQKRREQFYDDITPEMKVEFINGEIIVQSPARKKHIDVSGNLLTLLRTYVNKHHFGFVGHEKVLITLTRNDYEPDICFFSNEKAAGFNVGQTQFPAPDFIVEILSPSTADRDRGVKMVDYAAHGVREYWIVDVDSEAVERYRLDSDRFTLTETVTQDDLRSDVVAGFSVPLDAIFEEAANMEALKRILLG